MWAPLEIVGVLHFPLTLHNGLEFGRGIPGQRFGIRSRDPRATVWNSVAGSWGGRGRNGLWAGALQPGESTVRRAREERSGGDVENTVFSAQGVQFATWDVEKSDLERSE